MNRCPLDRRWLLAATLAAYLVVVASGAPLPIDGLFALMTPPASTAEGDTTERFPCEGCRCGCGTAARCWRNCCCHTLPQRLAWARREGVRPPDEALDRAEAAGLDVSDWRSESPYRVRLAIDPPEAPLGDEAIAALPPCCRAKALAEKRAAEEAPAPRESQKKPASSGVALLQAMACQGMVDAWLVLGEAPLTPQVEPAINDAVSPASALSTPLLQRVDEAPTPPPPESRPAVLFG